jgi:hypothetical protein
MRSCLCLCVYRHSGLAPGSEEGYIPQALRVSLHPYTAVDQICTSTGWYVYRCLYAPCPFVRMGIWPVRLPCTMYNRHTHLARRMKNCFASARSCASSSPRASPWPCSCVAARRARRRARAARAATSCRQVGPPPSHPHPARTWDFEMENGMLASRREAGRLIWREQAAGRPPQRAQEGGGGFSCALAWPAACRFEASPVIVPPARPAAPPARAAERSAPIQPALRAGVFRIRGLPAEMRTSVADPSPVARDGVAAADGNASVPRPRRVWRKEVWVRPMRITFLDPLCVCMCFSHMRKGSFVPQALSGLHAVTRGAFLSRNPPGLAFSCTATV